MFGIKIEPEEWFWYDDYELSEFPREKYFTTQINNTVYMLTHIPETGLYGDYCGQGDLRWAWVRLDIWKQWVRPAFLKDYENKEVK